MQLVYFSWGLMGNFLIYILYLFYGLAFFTLGVAITSRDTSFSNLKFARYLWLLAAFGYTHAVHEWFEIFFLFHSGEFSARFIPAVILAKLSLTLVSFIFLLGFGLAMLGYRQEKDKRPFFLILPLLLGFLLVYLTRQDLVLTSSLLRKADLWIRYFIALPGAVFSGIGFLLHSSNVRPVSPRGSLNLRKVGVAMLVYGIFGGLVPSGTSFFSVGLPIEFFRGIAAFFILHFTMQALRIFDIEWKGMIEERLNRFAHSEKINAIGKLAAGIAHEINNPLSNIQLNIEMLKSKVVGVPEEEKVRRRIDAIEQNVDRASKIARELLVFSREAEADLEPTLLPDVVESSLSLIGPRLHEYQVGLEYGETAPVMAIPWKLEEVFLNLLLNAMEATPVGGRLVVRTRQEGSSIIAEISDDGAGIAPEILGSIFDPFFTTKEVGKGTGLGLSICHGIMTAHGGRIEARSQVGRGTTMILTFPAGDAFHG